MDSLTDLAAGGVIWLLTPKVGRPNAVDAADVTEAAPIAGLAVTTTAAVSKDWTATRLVPCAAAVTAEHIRPLPASDGPSAQRPGAHAHPGGGRQSPTR